MDEKQEEALRQAADTATRISQLKHRLMGLAQTHPDYVPTMLEWLNAQILSLLQFGAMRDHDLGLLRAEISELRERLDNLERS